MKDQKNMYPIKTRHEKSRRIIYEFSYKMGVLNEKRCNRTSEAAAIPSPSEAAYIPSPSEAAAIPSPSEAAAIPSPSEAAANAAFVKMLFHNTNNTNNKNEL